MQIRLNTDKWVPDKITWQQQFDGTVQQSPQYTYRILWVASSWLCTHFPSEAEWIWMACETVGNLQHSTDSRLYRRSYFHLNCLAGSVHWLTIVYYSWADISRHDLNSNKCTFSHDRMKMGAVKLWWVYVQAIWCNPLQLCDSQHRQPAKENCGYKRSRSSNMPRISLEGMYPTNGDSDYSIYTCNDL